MPWEVSQQVVEYLTSDFPVKKISSIFTNHTNIKTIEIIISFQFFHRHNLSEDSILVAMARDRRRGPRSSAAMSELSTTFEANLPAHLQLLTFLETTASSPATQLTCASEVTLGRMLSQRSITFTGSSHAEREAFAEQSGEITFRMIGWGSCGAVFSQDGAAAVYKLRKAPRSSTAGVHDLYNDFRQHLHIHAALKRVPGIKNDVKVPKVHSWIPQTATTFWEEFEQYFQQAGGAPSLPCDILKTEKIRPLPPLIRNAFIQKFCPEQLREAAMKATSNSDCLARVYLGRNTTQERRQRMFSLRNINLNLDKLLAIGADVQNYAYSIAGALAALHWEAKVDGKDVEFVLGSATTKVPTLQEHCCQHATIDTYLGPRENYRQNFRRRVIRLWMLDFNLCSTISMDDEGVEQAALAWRQNDPYYPKPLGESAIEKELWDIFVRRYIEISNTILEQEPLPVRELPRNFLRRIKEIEQEVLERKLVAEERLATTFANYEG